MVVLDKILEEKKIDEPVATIWEHCKKCFQGIHLLKTIVVAICVAVVIQQLSMCVRKLINVPTTTYTHFDFNKTIEYPTITLCRDPPYKYDRLEHYGLYGHPRYTSSWINFNFSAVNLDKFWDDITYTPEEIFVMYGLDGYTANVMIKPIDNFIRGRCYSMVPLTKGTRAYRGTGFSFTVDHDHGDMLNSISTYPPGYHLYVHYTKEPFTEVEVLNGGFVDYLYVNTGEVLDVKLTVDKYIMISQEDEPCTNWHNYSANTCTTNYVHELAANSAGCSGPWMQHSMPYCSNYTSMRKLISSYIALYTANNCTICPRFCHANLYSAYVTNRQNGFMWDNSINSWSKTAGTSAEIQSSVSTLNIHFNAMMVSVHEQRHNYDWNAFISDLGGSVGFLLGLSVISLMSIFTKFWSMMVGSPIKETISEKYNDIRNSGTNDKKHQIKNGPPLK